MKSSKYVTELFKDFQEYVLAETNKSDMDYVKEQYATTELFDISNAKLSGTDELNSMINSLEETLQFNLPNKTLSLPFQNCFVKTYDNIWFGGENSTSCIFIREYAPNIITGALFAVFYTPIGKMIWRCPFTIRLLDDCAKVIVDETAYKLFTKMFDNFAKFERTSVLADILKPNFESVLIGGLVFIQEVFEKLSSHEVITDTPVSTEYYRFRDKSKKTIKVTNRPIYYVLDKKTYAKKKYSINPLGKLEHSYAFKVRGHWRKIDDKSIGKDRNGDYKVKGYTWVVDYIKGEGTLVNRVRIVKEVA